MLAEIALLSLLGQGVLWVLAGRRREQNVFYNLFQVLTRPWIRGARLLSPRIVLDRHLPLVAVLLLFFLWLAATLAKIDLCLRIGVHLCK
jgi:hypothetical protein